MKILHENICENITMFFSELFMHFNSLQHLGTLIKEK